MFGICPISSGGGSAGWSLAPTFLEMEMDGSDISNHCSYQSKPHNWRWCTFFESVYREREILACFDQIQSILLRIYALFGVLFTGLNNVAACTPKWTNIRYARSQKVIVKCLIAALISQNNLQISSAQGNLQSTEDAKLWQRNICTFARGRTPGEISIHLTQVFVFVSHFHSWEDTKSVYINLKTNFPVLRCIFPNNFQFPFRKNDSHQKSKLCGCILDCA